MAEQELHWDQLSLKFEKEDIRAIIEVLLFVSTGPLPAQRFIDILGSFYSESEIVAVIQQLSDEYDSRNSGLQIIEVGGGYRLCTRPIYDHAVRAFKQVKRKIRLSMPALETLAIIAYRQPITTPEIEAIRGVNVSAILKNLLEKRLITIIGRKKAAGNPLIYGTTAAFLEYFGLQELSSLPTIEEFFESFEETRE
ncbi:SMC-Scp complex subunit ScpB [candidate division CSSED10-310 bacterium]|uniref:SMC-Scp complex subunit ScpB n=1 Tax=candidate division CSSED10-310 bacterium TaxID=2855610 RepID=A0ABV6YS18_UNCC1